jgi:cytochrome c556
MAHFEKHDGRFVAAAVAIEAEGFGASIMRSVTAGVLLVRQTDVRSKTFQDARAGVRWLGSIAPGATPFDAEAMVGALEEALLCKAR